MLHHFIDQKLYIINKEIPVDRLIERRNGAVTFSKSGSPLDVESKNELSLLGLGVSDGVSFRGRSEGWASGAKVERV